MKLIIRLRGWENYVTYPYCVTVPSKEGPFHFHANNFSWHSFEMAYAMKKSFPLRIQMEKE